MLEARRDGVVVVLAPQLLLGLVAVVVVVLAPQLLPQLLFGLAAVAVVVVVEVLAVAASALEVFVVPPI